MVKKDNTEEIILQAAEKEFIEKGLEGARMQKIADRAGINKSLLHYYYRSKVKLFEIILSTAFRAFLPNILKIFKDDSLNFEQKIYMLTDRYINLLIKNPQIPNFVLHELSSNPQGLVKLLQKINPDIGLVYKAIEKAQKNNEIIDIDPEQLIINTISLCIFPFAAKPMVENIILKDREVEFKVLMEKRKTEVAEFIINSIKK